MASNKVTKESKVVPLSSLHPLEDNPNMHPQEQVKAIAESIDRYTQYYPIVVDEEMNILAGHGKKLALEYKGETTAEVVILRGLTDKQKKKLVIEDNKIQSMSYVNFSMVEKLIKDIGDTDIIGFSTDYLEAIINENVKDNAGIDFTQPAPKPKSREEQDEDIPDDTKQEQDEEYEDISSGMQQARTIICPHCGKEIVL
ncbi:MAG: ParB N-terminal domain-containing protein [Bacteroidales bacterium]|nr:ParB N-terminal domain-containing protein [Bacteroidales bacterium]